MIEVIDLKKVYRQPDREIRALDGVNLQVPADSVHGIIGASGAGKSTLVRCLAMLDRPSSGAIRLNGVEITAVGPTQLRTARRRLGVVFQHANLFDSRTIAANVEYPLELARLPRSERHDRSARLLNLVGLAEAQGAYPAQLSGGQRQRVGIARALATDPDVLLCDEPTSALDPATTAEILDLISELKARLGLSVLVITHEMHVVKRICDSVSLLEAGRIVESGSLTDVVGDSSSRLSSLLLGLPPHTAVPEQGVVIEVFSSGPDPVTTLTTAERGADTEFTVLAGTIEQIAGRRFQRLRIQLPPGSPVDPVLDQLHRGGIQASVVTESAEDAA